MHRNQSASRIFSFQSLKKKLKLEADWLHQILNAPVLQNQLQCVHKGSDPFSY